MPSGYGRPVAGVELDAPVRWGHSATEPGQTGGGQPADSRQSGARQTATVCWGDVLNNLILIASIILILQMSVEVVKLLHQ